MDIVAGTTLKHLEPRVWDPNSQYYLPALRAIMVSFAEFEHAKTLREKALFDGLHGALGVPKGVRIYLDNGAFGNVRDGKEPCASAFWKFVKRTKPDWYPIPADFIPLPSMNEAEQHDCFKKTMRYNYEYSFNGCVPVVHVGAKLNQYLRALKAHDALSKKKVLALGGLVPLLLQTKGTGSKVQTIDSITTVRRRFDGHIHAFGIGGTATLHLAAVAGLNSIDSAGWRNRAAHGIIQLPGRGDRLLTKMGTWRGRALDKTEREMLAACRCPGCLEAGIKGMIANGASGFYRRATHNLHVLLTELAEIERRLADNTYEGWYGTHVFNQTFIKLIGYTIKKSAKRVHI